MAKKKSNAQWYHVWPTAWGPVGATANDKGICGFTLPHYRPDDLLELMAWENPDSVRDESPFERLVELTGDYFNGRGANFGDIECDMLSAGSFGGKVLRACREIPYGQTSSYGALALTIGAPDSARAVAGALGKNAIPLIIPCHRVTYSGGGLGGFSAQGGVALKGRMLSLERGA